MRWPVRSALLSLFLLVATIPVAVREVEPDNEEVETYIVQAATTDAAEVMVRELGGRMSHRLGIIRAVAAELTEPQIRDLERRHGVRIYGNSRVHSLSLEDEFKGPPLRPDADVYYRETIGADQLHAQGIDGLGVTIAVVDSGVWGGIDESEYPLDVTDYIRHASWKQMRSITRTEYEGQGYFRLLAQYDAIDDVILGATGDAQVDTDDYGHGSHVASLAVNSAELCDVPYWKYVEYGFPYPPECPEEEIFLGVAPRASLVAVKVLDDQGMGTYADVIRGVDWVVNNAASYGIRVVNLSLGVPPRSPYWDDPLNQALMAAWQAGLVVVASAGNEGPDPMTITVPGNNPYIITVGAMTDNWTADGSDDWVTSFSSSGPTYEAFVKPDLVAPGGHLAGIVSYFSASIRDAHPETLLGENAYSFSGTSMSAALVSGAAALLLQAEPALTPDEVKCRLKATASPAMDSADHYYSLFRQGAGLLNVPAAVDSTLSGCANQGLDVAADLAGTQHFQGLARQDENGDYYIAGYEELGSWQSAQPWDDMVHWDLSEPWDDMVHWDLSEPWDDMVHWDLTVPWNENTNWSSMLTEPMNANKVVPHE